MQHGMLALKWCKVRLPIQVLQSAAGFFIGTADPKEPGPISRESQEYWSTREEAEYALRHHEWSQRPNP